jgi:hypothetical protein
MGTPSARLSQNVQPKMMNRISQSMTDSHSARGAGNTILATSDDMRAPDNFIYVYNILQGWDFNPITQPPTFPFFKIPTCAKGEKFSVTLLPAYTNLPFEREGANEGTTEIYYRKEDGRKAATSQLNPSAFPGTDWNSQLQNWDSGDQFGNNMNALGVFWSFTEPDDPKLDEEIALFRERVHQTMTELVKRAETLHAQGPQGQVLITPLMHFAMDYLGKQASWHMSLRHMISCPNCGESIPEGLAYHRNQFGDRCILDRARYEASIEKPRGKKAEAE